MMLVGMMWVYFWAQLKSSTTTTLEACINTFVRWGEKDGWETTIAGRALDQVSH